MTLDIGAIAMWAGAIMTIIGLATWTIKPIRDLQRKAQTDNEAIMEGVRILLQMRFERECERALRRKCITIRDQHLISELYNAYHALGGNGGITTLHEHVMDLPVTTQHNTEDNNGH